MDLNCPKCVDQKLEETEGPDGLRVEACGWCGGLWLDKGRLDAFFDDPAAVEALIAEGEKLEMPTARRCPRCTVHLKQFRVPGGELFLDACVQCSGVWFDQGELEELGAEAKGRPAA